MGLHNPVPGGADRRRPPERPLPVDGGQVPSAKEDGPLPAGMPGGQGPDNVRRRRAVRHQQPGECCVVLKDFFSREILSRNFISTTIPS